MKPILEIQNISKKYRINHQSGSYVSLREKVLSVLRFEKQQQEDFWALNDVSFSVNPGESIGIIGRNGAGKSTLLKVLSKITPPTKGKIISRGRIASLLEVGTGFHPELTGRENIFFNGSLLGMKRKEIELKFDEIVDFSGVEKFLDTPLKHYSSGMQLRLAFAVAAFLEPEILIIDEVLAVGDAEFQKKCMGKMEDVSRSGRTILFVSHDMTVMAQMCKTLVLLDSGRILSNGSAPKVISEYLYGLTENSIKSGSKKLSDSVLLEKFEFSSVKIKQGESLDFTILIKSDHPNKISGLALLIYNGRNERIGIIDLRHEQLWELSNNNSAITIEGTIKEVNLVNGYYSLGLYILSNQCRGDFYDLNHVQVDQVDSSITLYPVEHRGHVDLKNEFTIHA